MKTMLNTTKSVQVLLLLTVSLLLASASPAAVVVDNYWRLGEDDPGAADGVTMSGSTIDNAGNNDMSVINSPVYSDTVAQSAVDSVGSTLDASFGSSYLQTAGVQTLQDNIGVEMWINPTVAGAFTAFQNGDSDAWALRSDGNIWQIHMPGAALEASSATVDINEWQHIALVRESGTWFIYKDAEQFTTGVTNTPSPTGDMSIAAQPGGGEMAPTDTLIDEVRLFHFNEGEFSTNDLLVSQTIPEPGSLVLLALGGVALLGGRRRSRV